MDPLYFFLLLLAGAALLVVVGKSKDAEDAEFRLTAIRTQGVVVENQICWSESTVVRPVVRFTTEQGEVVQALDEHGMALAVPRFAQGQSVVLLYNKYSPTDFRILSSGRFA